MSRARASYAATSCCLMTIFTYLMPGDRSVDAMGIIGALFLCTAAVLWVQAGENQP